jgi:hypothetical protein
MSRPFSATFGLLDTSVLYAAGLCALEALFSCRLDCGRLTVVAGSAIGEAV